MTMGQTRFAVDLLLGAAAALVPQPQRAEWLAEWKGEAWHVCQQEPRGLVTLQFCLGAFPDAFWLRRAEQDVDQPAFRFTIARLRMPKGSAAHCLVLLAAWTLLGFLFCVSIPSARMALSPPVRTNGTVVMISGNGYAGISTPSIRFADYRAWRIRTGRIFGELAFYQPIVRRIRIGHRSMEAVSIARGSDTLLDFLSLPSSEAETLRAPDSGLPQLLLSREIWQRVFGGDRRVIGQLSEIAGQSVRIAGVLPDQAWPLPAHPDAVLLESRSSSWEGPARAKGFVLGRVRPEYFAVPPPAWWFLYIPGVGVDSGVGADVDRFDCIALTRIRNQPLLILLFTLVLAALALPATTPLPLGDYPSHTERYPATALRRWAFLAVKFTLILAAVYFWSVAVAYSELPIGSPASLYLQFGLSFAGFLCALRWAWRDQRKRCPVCLHLLSNPARVGHASHNFLSWSGTEWACAKGHGLLHVPELPTSWLSIQRWLHLDASWRSLFPAASDL